MTRPIAVLRPEPGNAVTAARVEALGLAAIRLPLFEVRAIDWTPSDPRPFDALVLTSANAPRHAGAGLAAFADLPVFAVGEATAAAARDAGLTIAEVGTGDGNALLTTAARRGVQRALLLGGRDRAVDSHPIIAAAVAVYASEPIAIAADALRQVAGSVALLHSPRAARRLAELVDAAGLDRQAMRLAAISPAAAAAAGPGWGRIAFPPAPEDRALVDLACTLAD